MKNNGVMITWGISSALGVLFVIGCSLIAATSPPALLIPPTANLTVVEILPMVVPTTAAVAVASTIWLDTVTLANTTAGSLTVTLADRQTSPITVLPAVSIPAYTLVVMQLWGTRMDNGFTWVASWAGVNGYIRGKVRR